MRIAVGLLAIALAAGACRAQSNFAFRDIGATSAELTEDAKPVFVYHFGGVLAPEFPATMRRSCYVHPVYAPDGTVLTDDFNKDHPHHRGIYWARPDVRVGGKTGDIWAVQGFQQRFVRWIQRKGGGPLAVLSVENGWFDGDREFVKETVEIVAHPSVLGRRILDFRLRFEAVDSPVTVVGTAEETKGYGGFTFRTAKIDGGARATVIRTEKGVLAEDGVLARHPWAEISGLFGGKSETVHVEDSPDNPGYPNNGWLLRHGFALMNVSYPGLAPITLDPGKPLTLRYKVILTSGNAAITDHAR